MRKVDILLSVRTVLASLGFEVHERIKLTCTRIYRRRLRIECLRASL